MGARAHISGRPGAGRAATTAPVFWTLAAARRGRARGQALPLLGLTLLLLLAFSALALDGVMAFAWRRNVVNAADAAALVGVRALIEERSSGSADAINDAVGDYLSSALDVPSPDFAVYYVDRSGRRLPVGAPTPIAGGARPPSDTRGISVEVRYTFDTYLMAMFGQEDLTVSGLSTARFGNAGTVVGGDLVPLGLNQTAAQMIRDPSNRAAGVRLDLGGWIQDHNETLLAQWAGDPAYVPNTDPPYPGWVDPRTFVRQDQARSVRLLHGYAQPELGTSSSCGDIPGEEDTLQYWWCSGSPHQMHVGDPFPSSWNTLVQDLVGLAPVDASLIDNSWIGTRHNEIAIIPVYVEVAAVPGDAPSGVGELYVIDHFLAVELQSANYAQDWVRVRYLSTYTTSGGLVGTNNNIERGDPCEVCAVNLVREVP